MKRFVKTCFEFSRRHASPDEAIAYLKRVFSETDPVRHKVCQSENDFIERSESLSPKTHVRQEKKKQDPLESLRGWWLETVYEKGKMRLSYSVGRFYQDSEGWKYSGTAYGLDGEPKYTWHAPALAYARNGFLSYSYEHVPVQSAADSNTSKSSRVSLGMAPNIGFGCIQFVNASDGRLKPLLAWFADVNPKKKVRLEAKELDMVPFAKGLAKLRRTLRTQSWGGITWSQIDQVIKSLHR